MPKNWFLSWRCEINAADLLPTRICIIFCAGDYDRRRYIIGNEWM